MTGYARALMKQIETMKSTLAAMHRDLEDYELRIRAQERIRERMSAEVYSEGAPVLTYEQAILQALLAALDATKGNKMRAAKILQINPKTVYHWIKKYGVVYRKKTKGQIG